MILDMNPGGVVKVGVIWKTREEILENVMRAINGVVENLPRKWTGKLFPLLLTSNRRTCFITL
ncbi:hypothetical protein NC651_034343 [Populus alba x Populus x berolinensis]|nr:hypothetical protein NC651_034343 [Populus alba x Populus x berolinensis]